MDRTVRTMNGTSLGQQHPHWGQTLRNKQALVCRSRATGERGNRKEPFQFPAFAAWPDESWAFLKHAPGRHVAQTCSSTSASRFLSKAGTGARFRPTGFLSKTFDSILAQAMGKHRAMPADSWTKELRDEEQVSEGRKLHSLLTVAVISSVP